MAIVIGQVLDHHLADNLTGPLAGLCVVVAVSCACELQVTRSKLPWVSAAEGLMVGLLVGLAGGAAESVYLYLAIPAVAAGVKAGRFGTVNTWLATLVAFTTAGTAGTGELRSQATSAALWLSVGLGAGVLAAHQARSLRRIESAHAPYAAAHRLVGQLHTLVHERPELLDVSTQAAGLRTAIHSLVDATSSVIFVDAHDGLQQVSASDSVTADNEEAGRLCAFFGQRLQRDDSVALPLRVGQHVLGAIVITTPAVVSKDRLDSMQQLLDEHAIRLETALLVDDVRMMATAEERNRLAREIHDGVAQRVVAMGYLADEVTASSGDPAIRQGAERLRAEITLLIAELRFSVFDLRHDVERAGGLSAALSEYVQELSSHSHLRVHLTLDERDGRLSRRTEAELLRVAQEAIGNVHRHARAINVWVRLHVSGSEVRLSVEDDGVGGAAPRAGHYGMHTMRERAERIGADLQIGTRHDGGTTVTVRSHSTAHNTTGAQDDHDLARR